VKFNKNNKRVQLENIRLKIALRVANKFKDLYLQKWEKWEERARLCAKSAHTNLEK
jgi:hypothetical protein